MCRGGRECWGVGGRDYSVVYVGGRNLTSDTICHICCATFSMSTYLSYIF